MTAKCEKCLCDLTVYIEDRPIQLVGLVHAGLCPACRREFEVWVWTLPAWPDLRAAEAREAAAIASGNMDQAYIESTAYIYARRRLLADVVAWLADKKPVPAIADEAEVRGQVITR